MPMDQDSPLHQSFPDCFNKNTMLDPKWQQMAEDELNETPENYKERLNLLQHLVSSK